MRHVHACPVHLHGPDTPPLSAAFIVAGLRGKATPLWTRLTRCAASTARQGRAKPHRAALGRSCAHSTAASALDPASGGKAPSRLGNDQRRPEDGRGTSRVLLYQGGRALRSQRSVPGVGLLCHTHSDDAPKLTRRVCHPVLPDMRMQREPMACNACKCFLSMSSTAIPSIACVRAVCRHRSTLCPPPSAHPHNVIHTTPRMQSTHTPPPRMRARTRAPHPDADRPTPLAATRRLRSSGFGWPRSCSPSPTTWPTATWTSQMCVHVRPCAHTPMCARACAACARARPGQAKRACACVQCVSVCASVCACVWGGGGAPLLPPAPGQIPSPSLNANDPGPRLTDPLALPPYPGPPPGAHYRHVHAPAAVRRARTSGRGQWQQQRQRRRRWRWRRPGENGRAARGLDQCLRAHAWAWHCRRPRPRTDWGGGAQR